MIYQMYQAQADFIEPFFADEGNVRTEQQILRETATEAGVIDLAQAARIHKIEQHRTDPHAYHAMALMNWTPN